MDGLTITGGVIVMKKLITAALLTIGMGTAQATPPETDISCPPTTTCTAGHCSFVSPTTSLIFKPPAHTIPPADGTYSFVGARAYSLFLIQGSPASGTPFVFCNYQSNPNDPNTFLILTGSWTGSANVAYYADSANSVKTWSAQSDGLVTCSSTTAADCLFQIHNYASN